MVSRTQEQVEMMANILAPLLLLPVCPGQDSDRSHGGGAGALRATQAMGERTVQ